MTQSIVIQVGQCGNQIGCRFWDLALRKHAHINKKGVYDDALASFFRNVRCGESEVSLPVGDRVSSLRARAVLVDMEAGVINDLLTGPLRHVFDHRQLITDVTGSGNNWATGYKMYGERYRDKIVDTIRRAAELCDCLQCFFILHSMGGGTGSGVGTSILSVMRDEFPDVYRFVVSIFPSANDDVITSPYNSVLALRELTNNADCVMPIENQALLDVCDKVNQGLGKMRPESAITGSGKSDKWPFEKMNYIVSNLLLNMTSSARFDGSLNVDLNEITMNLVPYPGLHYIIPSMTPLYHLADMNVPPRRLDQMFSDAFTKDYQLISTTPRSGVILATALMLRGNVNISDVRRNIDKLRQSGLTFIPWNQEGWKTGLCSVPPLNQDYSLLALTNNTGVRHTFLDLERRFTRLYQRRAHLHHYLKVDGMEASDFDESLASLRDVVTRYGELEEQGKHPPTPVERFKVM